MDILILVSIILVFLFLILHIVNKEDQKEFEKIHRENYQIDYDKIEDISEVVEILKINIGDSYISHLIVDDNPILQKIMKDKDKWNIQDCEPFILADDVEY